jgi:hypothetical protein
MITLIFKYRIELMVESTFPINHQVLLEEVQKLFYVPITRFINLFTYSEDKRQVTVDIADNVITLMNAGFDVESKVTHLNNSVRKAIPGCSIKSKYTMECNNIPNI